MQYSAMDQIVSELFSALRSLNSSAQVKLLGSMTPSVTSLITTSNSSQKLSNGTHFHQLSSSNMPPLLPKHPSGSRLSHEIITIGDSPVTKNPPPTPSTGLTGVQSLAPHRSLLLVITHEQNSQYSYIILLLCQPTFLASNQSMIIHWAYNNCCLVL